MKRFFDILISSIGLLLLFPLFTLIAIWIKVDSNGPIFYRQLRVGKNNQDFRIYKFRSMYLGADNGSLVTIGTNDSRITKSGSLIRKYKLDELPQLINVFLGDMSLVGPRPEVRYYVNFWTTEQMHILDIKPGITDPASIKYRNENILLGKVKDPESYYKNVIMQEKLKMNLDYLYHSNLLYDAKLIFNTISAVIFK